MGIELEIVIPAYNEELRIGASLDRLAAALAELRIDAGVVVVDNGSIDGTREIVGGWSGPVPVRLVHCPRRGKGAAVQFGLLATAAPYAGFCDADMATDPLALSQVVDLLRRGEEVIVGNRRHPSSTVTARRRRLRRHGALLFNRLARGLAGGLTDTQCGFKFFHGPLVRAVAADLRIAGFVFDVELLVRCLRSGAAIAEVPVRWTDQPGSRFSVWRHSLPCLRDLARIVLLARQTPGGRDVVRPAQGLGVRLLK